MSTKFPALVALAAAASGAAPVAAAEEPCLPHWAAPNQAAVSSGRRCKDEDRLRPYEPERQRAGRTPGSVDLGNGTEVRIGGSVRMDYEVRR